MKSILLFIFLGYLVLCPFYVFTNGQPQPADIILALGFLLFLWKADIKLLLINKPIKILGVLVALIALVAIGNQIYLSISRIQGNTIYPVLFYIFNFLAFSFVLYLSNTIGKQKLFNYSSIALIITITIQFLLAVFEVQNTTSTWVQSGNRFVLFFNNPNQLGYFCLLILSLFVIIPSTIKRNKFVLVAMTVMAFYIALVSQSRIAVIGILYLIVFIVLTEFRPYTKKSILTMVFILGSSLLLLNTIFIKDRLTSIKTRSVKRSTTIKNEMSTRGFDRIYKHPVYLLIGAGEGADQQFSDTNKELHSGFGTMLFSYGVLGFTLFFILLFQVLKYNLIYNGLLLLPVFLYNLVHHGLRNTLFWFLLGFVLVITEKKN
ncbi:MAG: hypothetical protein QM499_01945 [Flavobacteriaceae bacterium]